MKMFNITSYDVPVDIRDRINGMVTKEEVMAYRDSVKAPNACKPGDPDLQVWWACQSVLSNIEKPRPSLYDVTDHQVAVADWVLSPAYDDE